ncbi:hypothetical protein [Pseudomonas sp. HLMP]|uniref:hypothetical protein n=1 Tax=Pseudomonas sp. HLMP TaxID=3153767 RepID=UPI003966BC53
MIDINGWPVKLQIILIMIPFVIGMSGVAISACIAGSASFYIAISAIKSNPYLEQMKGFWGMGSFKSRWLLICSVCGLVTFPGPHLRRGLLSPEELDNFPVKLRRRMVISVWLTIVGLVWLAIFAGLVELTEYFSKS